MKKLFSIPALVPVLTLICVGQTALTNDAVIKMVKAGLGDEIVISSINSQPGKYQTQPEDLITLKSSGVSDKVISLLISKSGAPASSASAANSITAPTVIASPTAVPVTEVGVYYRKNETWVDLPPEVVNFKTGGVLKTIGTAGVVKGDVNGRVNGAHSPNLVRTPVSLLVYAAEGVSVTEYQLLRLREGKDAREFRTLTGGVLHVSSGASRDLVTFQNKKVAPRTWEIPLPNIQSGEYGLLAPASADATASTGRIGKIYSFRVLE